MRKYLTMEKVMHAVALLMTSVILFILILLTVDRITSGAAACELTVKKAVSNDEKYLRSHVINVTTCVGFIEYGCPDKKILRDCKGLYYVFVNRVDDKWVVENDKHTIW